ncbi:MAG: hypothetical protein PVG65_03935 [Candidatus Thorarchaeota archaeon]
MIPSEHVYKDPKRAFLFMKQTKPQDCFLFPGMEYLTKEGIDIVIFSNNEKLYSYKKLQPYKMTYEQTISFIEKYKLHAFCAHPYGIGFASIIHAEGHDFYKKTVDKLGAVEVCNTSFENLRKLLSIWPFRVLFREKKERLDKIKELPKQDYPKKIKFLAVGSDAHQFKEVGTGALIKSKKGQIFRKIISNKSPQIVKKNRRFNLYFLMKELLMVFEEFLIKHRLLKKIRGFAES